MPLLNNHLKTGVYAIRNLLNGKMYIGSAAVDFKQRWRGHRSNLRLNRHHSIHLQRAWNKYGEQYFEFIVLEYCTPLLCTTKEQKFIDTYRTANCRYGYNRNPSAHSRLGIKATDETKAKISEANRRRGPDTRAKMSESQRTRFLNPMEREKLAAAKRGRRGNNTGHRHSTETKAKLSESARARWINRRGDQ